MVSECDRLVKLSLPAARIAVAKFLDSRHSMTEAEIARGLGVTQAAVSKYINKKHSAETNHIIRMIKKAGVDKRIGSMVVSGAGMAEINRQIDISVSMIAEAYQYAGRQ